MVTPDDFFSKIKTYKPASTWQIKVTCEKGPSNAKHLSVYLTFLREAMLDNSNSSFHLLQAQGFVEHFKDKCGGVISWVNQVSMSIAFAEGWGLYAEMLIAEDTDSYNDHLWQRFGALKWRVGY